MNEAELVFTEMLCCDRLSLYLDRQRRLERGESALAAQILRKRINGEPLQYIFGKSEFMGFDFRVSPDVLIPRPETEILVESAKTILSAATGKGAGCEILELGTGSGCIAVSLARLLPRISVTATDISKKALAVASLNASLNNVRDRIKFLESDLFKNSRLRRLGYDMIISNPPYIASAEIPLLAPEVRREPEVALRAGKDGLGFYRRIIRQAGRYLKAGGFLLLETGFSQRKAIEDIFFHAPVFKVKEWVKDYNHIERVAVAQKAGKYG